MWLLLGCVLAYDLSQFKCDTICYEHDHTSDFSSCKIFEQAWNDDIWSQIPGMEETRGEYIKADASNAKEALGRTKNYGVLVYVYSPMSGEGNDIFDLGQFDDRRVVNMLDLAWAKPSKLMGNVTQQVQKLVKSHLKAVAKLGRSGKFSNAKDFGNAVSRVLRQKERKYLGSLVPRDASVKDSNALASSSDTECHLMASSDCYSKIEYLVLIPSNVVFHSEVRVPYMYLVFWLGTIVNAHFIKADYMLTDSGSVSDPIFKNITFKDLAVITADLEKVVFTENGWKATYYEYGSGRTTIDVSFDLVSYAAGLTSMPFWSFFIATGIGQLPATLVYSYVGGMLTGGAQLLMTGLLILFALSALVVMLRKIYMDRQKIKQGGTE